MMPRRRASSHSPNIYVPTSHSYLLQISEGSHVGRVVAESAAAFRMLRKELAQRGPDSQLFKPSPQPTTA